MSSLLALSRRLPSQWSITRWAHSSERRYHTADTTAKKKTIHDAIIIGGGPTGLLLSNLLSSYNIHSHLLLDKRPVEELLKHPQAHFINVRSMEILKAEVPRVYESVLKEMPDVSEWDGFHFGGSVLESGDGDVGGGKRLGRAIHPVRENLRVGQSGDAILVPKTTGMNDVEADNNAIMPTEDDGTDDAPLVSLCRPAHLAQNKFVSLLLQEASRRHHTGFDDKEDATDNGDSDSNKSSNFHLRYGEEVTRISEHNHGHGDNNQGQQPYITIHTSQGQSYHTRYLLAADGVQSFARQHYGIPMMGDSSMQNLMNVHFRTNDSLSKLLMSRSNNQAMLHFVYNSHLVGAFVCHDGNKGEWVLQIPFFPPFQTMETDFDSDTVRDMIWAGLVGTRNTDKETADNEDDFNFEILSIRPWTMSSLVAQRYFNDSGNMALVGDAAHAFPPAGGFGMNTGLQDAHNIAWRLALLLQGGNRNAAVETLKPEHVSVEPTSFVGNNIMSKYDQERRPIATQNAALSVRNYQRTLRIAKACYLDAQHPQLLISMLSSPPMSLLPLEARQNMFRRLVRVAMMPLGTLLSSPQSSSGGRSFHADHIEKNVRSILENGGSLPLVFPRYELGFSYQPNGSSRREIANNETGDTSGYVPRLQVGHRMPLVLLEVLASSFDGNENEGWAVLETLNPQQTDHGNPADTSSDSAVHVSLADISSQLRRASSHSSPLFTLLVVGPSLTSSVSLTWEAVNCVMKRWNVPIMIVNVLPEKNNVDDHQNNVGSSNQHLGSESKGFDVVYAVDTQNALLQLLHDEKSLSHNNRANENDDGANENALIMVRPDGHIANICWVNKKEGEDEIMSKHIQQAVEQGFQNALG
mmetsp:Transcript_6481/g.14653  ORF Transcript_6481/g.14653 Transcript_6481/m.14653 type:complete len:865 (+) Transcript_6481:28-2622(+)